MQKTPCTPGTECVYLYHTKQHGTHGQHCTPTTCGQGGETHSRKPDFDIYHMYPRQTGGRSTKTLDRDATA